jgi:hypothetical protein
MISALNLTLFASGAAAILPSRRLAGVRPAGGDSPVGFVPSDWDDKSDSDPVMRELGLLNSCDQRLRLISYSGDLEGLGRETSSSMTTAEDFSSVAEGNSDIIAALQLALLRAISGRLQEHSGKLTLVASAKYPLRSPVARAVMYAVLESESDVDLAEMLEKFPPNLPRPSLAEARSVADANYLCETDVYIREFELAISAVRQIEQLTKNS